MSPSGKGQSRRRREGEHYSDELHATDPLVEKEPGQQESRGRVEGTDHCDDGEQSPLGRELEHSVRQGVQATGRHRQAPGK